MILCVQISLFYDLSQNMRSASKGMLTRNGPLNTHALPLYIYYIPKVLEQMPNIWTRLEVASTHTLNAVRSAFV